MKRRFSWENITKSKESKRSKKRRARKFILPLDFGSRKSSPKSKSTFKTSTPLKGSSEKSTATKPNVNESCSFGNNTSISQVTFNKPQTTCSDRLGVPKTSLNDFKRLLLNATNNKRVSAKPSAVEQLKLKNESLNTTPMKILDLSSSPKSFANRRVFQQVQASTLSPYKKTNLMSPRSRWKYSNFHKSYIDSIPEVNVEDDATSIDSQPDEMNETVENTPICKTPEKKPVIEHDQNANISKLMPITQMPIVAETNSSPETGVIETNFSGVIESSFKMSKNMFRLVEENNFMPSEIRTYGAPFAKSKLKPIEEVPQKPDIVPTTAPTLETSF